MERIFALIAIGLGTLSGAVGLILALIGKLTIPNDIWFAYSITLISVFMVYVYAWFEKNQKTIEKIAASEFDGIEIFRDSGAFLERVTALTVGANVVCTINLSDTPNEFIHLESYFANVHKYISTSTSLTSFRRIAGLQSAEKALWFVKASAALIKTSRISAAFADLRNPDIVDLCFHVVERDEGAYVFFFPSVDLTGKMPAILIKNDLVANAMISYFDGLWRKLPHLHEGQKINKSAFAILEGWFPDLQKNSAYAVAKLTLTTA